MEYSVREISVGGFFIVFDTDPKRYIFFEFGFIDFRIKFAIECK